MAAVVASYFSPGGKSLTKEELKQVCDILGIEPDVTNQLPVGDACVYHLFLASQAKIPKSCTNPEEPHFKMVGTAKAPAKK